MSDRIPVRTLTSALVDDPVDLVAPAHAPDPIGWPGYADRLEDARRSSGSDEAVRVVRGRVAGSPVEAVFALWDFAFLGGSMGTVVGERLITAYDEARSARLPLVLLPATGGARLQEGMAALTQMPATLTAARRHTEAGLLQVAYLRDPTTGGVFASHVNAAHVVFAEPGATIGFAGPRVAEAMTDGPLPDRSHTAEGARSAGLVDDIVALEDLPGRLARLLSWPGRAEPHPVATPDGEREPAGTAWESVERARHRGRARAAAFLGGLDVRGELHGDRAGDDDPTVRVALARHAGRPIVVVAMDRNADGGRVTPAGYRKAWRGFDLAESIGVPLVTLVDTPGADAGAASEAGGIAHHIAATMDRLLRLRSPTIALVIGEGGSGGALALSVADRLLIQEHAIFSVIAPEGAAAILHRDPSRAQEVAGDLRLTAADLAALGIADGVVAEPREGEVQGALAVLAHHLDDLDTTVDPRSALASRLQRWGAPLGPRESAGP
jgi:acyl-CoA carboxylase subunit beta